MNSPKHLSILLLLCCITFQRVFASTSDTIDITYARCQWTIMPAKYYITGKVTFYYHPTFTSVHSITLNLANALVVDSVRYHRGVAIFSHSGNKITVSFPSSVSIGHLDSVTIAYEGQPPVANAAFISGKHGSKKSPTIWTLSEPYGAADWWPCKNSLTDKIDSIDEWITYPTGYTEAGNGLLLSNNTLNGMITSHWKHRFPVATYLVALDVANFNLISNTIQYKNQSLPFPNYVYPEDKNHAISNADSVQEVMQYYDSLYEVYPFEKEQYGQAEITDATTGMEHQTMAYIGSYSFYLSAHELAHQWFGDKVTCGSWSDIWLNESFAEYSSWLAFRRFEGYNTWQSILKSNIKTATSKPTGSVYITDTTAKNIFNTRITYGKGPFVLHMLRWELGDQAYFSALRSYLDDPKLAFGFARTRDLQAHLEQAGGIKLDTFMNEWFYGQGYPSYTIHSSQDQNKVLHLTLSQVSSDPSSVPFFVMDLPIQLSGKKKDTTVRLHNSYNGQAYSIPLNFTVTIITFDPQHWILSSGNSTNSILTDIDNSGMPMAFQAYPNPAKKELTVRCEDCSYSPRFVLINSVGQRWRLPVIQSDGKEWRLNLDGYPDGIYILRVINNEKTVETKLVVSR